jgi:hypothetical protein
MPSGYFMYYFFIIQKFYVLSTECIKGQVAQSV